MCLHEREICTSKRERERERSSERVVNLIKIVYSIRSLCDTNGSALPFPENKHPVAQAQRGEP
jgi:hypothetical protein